MKISRGTPSQAERTAIAKGECSPELSKLGKSKKDLQLEWNKPRKKK